MSLVTHLGFPRIGLKRELKRALEAHWRDNAPVEALHEAGRELRARHWRLARDAGADVVPCNDFSLYDHVLDTAVLFDAIPDRYRPLFERSELDGYFAMARGHREGGHDLHALEMTKWFDTNYHYLVPELHAGQRFALAGDKPLAEFREAQAHGHRARPVLLGPVSFLRLSKSVEGSNPLDLLDALLPAYAGLLRQLAEAGADWVQLDEPCLALDQDAGGHAAYRKAYAGLSGAGGPQILLASYFGALGDNLALAVGLPVHGLHVDLARAPHQLDAVLDVLKKRPDPQFHLAHAVEHVEQVHVREAFQVDQPLGVFGEQFHPAAGIARIDRLNRRLGRLLERRMDDSDRPEVELRPL